MKRLTRFVLSGALLTGVFGFFAMANLYAQRRPATPKGPSVTWKAPTKTNGYIGAETCAGCHRDIAKQFFKTVHAQEGESVQPTPTSPGKAEPPSVAEGRKIYNDMMCAGCHKIGGKGGTGAPPLDNVGARRTREQLMDRMLKRRAGTIMPTLPPDMSTEKIKDLVDYLMTLKGGAETAAQPAAAPAGPKRVSGCEVCHGPGRAHAEAEQSAAGDPAKIEAGMKLIFSFNASPKENDERCLTCHITGHAQDSFAHSMHATAGVSCKDCHTMHPTELADAGKARLQTAQAQFFGVPRLKKESAWLTGPMLKEPQPGLCFSCHRTVQAQFALPEHHRVGEGFMKCTDCHNPHGSMNHFNLNKANWESCVSCHVEKRGPFVYEHAVVRVDGCTACHTPHGSVNNFLLKRRELRLLCLQCHAAIHGTSGFNGQANVPHGRHGFQTSGPCTRCHVAIHGSNFDPNFLR